MFTQVLEYVPKPKLTIFEEWKHNNKKPEKQNKQKNTLKIVPYRAPIEPQNALDQKSIFPNFR